MNSPGPVIAVIAAPCDRLTTLGTSTFAGPSERTNVIGLPGVTVVPEGGDWDDRHQLGERGVQRHDPSGAALGRQNRPPLWFDGFNDWVTVTDTTASPLA